MIRINGLPDDATTAVVPPPLFITNVAPQPVAPTNLSLDLLSLSAATFVMGNAGSSTSAAPYADAHSSIAERADIARAQSGMTGAGVKIGILSDSFNLRGGMAADVAAGNLPAGTVIQEEGTSGSDEGRAMAQLIHQVAPGAAMVFHSATRGEADFANGIADLRAAGCTVIVDDVAYLDEPFFQAGGSVGAAVTAAVATGASYFTAASNQGRNFEQETFQGQKSKLPGLPGQWMAAKFGGQAFTTLTIPQNGTGMVDLQWDQPYASIGAGSGSANSLAIALYTSAGQLVGVAGAYDVAHDPRQVLSFHNTLATSSFRVVVFSNSAKPPPDLFKLIVYGNATLTGAGAGTGSGSVIGHELTAGANTVGAVAWNNTPAFGGTGTPEAFSSVGTGQIMFDASGNRLPNTVSANKVSFLAPDGSVTSVLAPFYGTSAAAPNAAGVAALMLQADPNLSPAQVSAILAQTAAPVAGGFGAVGAGLIQADAAVAMAQSMVGHSSLG